MNEIINTTIIQRQFKLSDLALKTSDVAELMGYTNEIPDNIREIIESELSALDDVAGIKGGYQLKQVQSNISDYSLQVEKCNFFVGKAVFHYLKNIEQVALFVCTAGKVVSDRSKNLMNSGELLEGYVVDVIGSAIVEKAMAVIHEELSDNLSFKNVNCTNRYSPGYCNWDVVEQHKLFSLLPQNFCGISLTPSSLMIPVKSVSGFIGIGTNVTFHDYQCASCNSNNCIYRGKNK
ncbi:hypothetical protein KDU71_13975 [Carboxylicivirga sediminis]|uniref:AdoMet activation domain-containing protein n=1 Tax=Carboxylicivirga sediminis TaxID=2006564 RepID=A0A941F597_9BACT|nr:vitamin B12 dependent-methionine synthase activation domain-containing protein [Carboxylicivirga sediminis]MBR8536679.1 hypothetical protein [Carboxylicivirga sediminis]